MTFVQVKDFLAARIAEDEASIRNSPVPWRVLDECRSKRTLIPLIDAVAVTDPSLARGMIEALAGAYGTHPFYGNWTNPYRSQA
jgi:hypothetical protein